MLLLFLASPQGWWEYCGQEMVQDYIRRYRKAQQEEGILAAVGWVILVAVPDVVVGIIAEWTARGSNRLRATVMTSKIVRLGGVAAVAAGTIISIATITSIIPIPYVYARGYAQDSDLSLPLSLPLSISYPVYLGVLMSVGYISLCLLGRSRSHLGTTGFILGCVSAMCSAVATCHEMSTIAVYITSSDSGIMTATQGVDNTMAAMLWLQAMTGAASMLMLGAQSIKSQALGGWESLPVLLGFLQLCPLVDIFFGLPPIIFFEGNVLLGTGWVVLGSVIWRRATAQRVESNVAPSN